MASIPKPTGNTVMTSGETLISIVRGTPDGKFKDELVRESANKAPKPINGGA